MNKVTLIGRLTKDPESRQINGANGQTMVANCRIAVDRRRQNQEQEADFIDFSCFGKTAEVLTRYTHKGSKVAIFGRITTGKYTDREGKNVYTTSVTAEEVEFLDPKPQNGNGAPAPGGYDGQGQSYGNAPAGGYGGQNYGNAPAGGYGGGQSYGNAPAGGYGGGQSYGAPAQQPNGAPAGNYGNNGGFAAAANAPAPAPNANGGFGNFAAAANAPAPAPNANSGYGAPAPAGGDSAFINVPVPDGLDAELPFR